MAVSNSVLCSEFKIALSEVDSEFCQFGQTPPLSPSEFRVVPSLVPSQEDEVKALRGFVRCIRIFSSVRSPAFPLSFWLGLRSLPRRRLGSARQ